MRERRRSTDGQAGFALILAILSLMLLTFLGLTLATTTSTELQIATNFRWSQQALYNAEAGLEVAKVILSNVASSTGSWQTIVPAPRTAPWAAPLTASAPAPPAGPVANRDYERNNCGDRGGMGYGAVLRGSGTAWQNVSTLPAPFNSGALPPINGALTIWVRRELVSLSDGRFTDDLTAAPQFLVVTAEGVAPYIGASTAFTRANQATRVLEMTYSLVLGGDACMRQGTQEGAGPTGENFDACSPLTGGPTGSLGAVFGGGRAGAGTLTALPTP